HVGVEEGAGIATVVSREGGGVPVPADDEVEGGGSNGIEAKPRQVLLAGLVHRTLEVGGALDGRQRRCRACRHSEENRCDCAPDTECERQAGRHPVTVDVSASLSFDDRQHLLPPLLSANL